MGIASYEAVMQLQSSYSKPDHCMAPGRKKRVKERSMDA